LRRSWLPERLSRVHLVNSGSEAAETAIKLARQYHRHRGDDRRWRVVGRRSSYHGVTLGALSACGHTSRRRGFEPLLHEFPLAPACYPLRCGLCGDQSGGKGGCTLACADAVEATILAAGPETVSAFIAEPIVGTSGGALVPPDGYWPRVQEICRRHGILLIIDEVITGFGRTGRRLGIDHFGIEPDIMTAAKGLTGGYAPLGAVIATDAVIEPLLRAGDDIMFHTFGGHPPACAAANAVLAILERERLVERAAEYGERLGQRLRDVLGKHPNVAEVRGRGMLWAVELVADRETLEPFAAARHLTIDIIKAGIERGVFYYPGGTGDYGDVIILGPAFTISEQEIDLMATTLRDSIDAAVAG
jgi:adenosylmethionine-8-amino-7-oxononanoate aminotransferase